ncbi:HNH endonuclease [Bradyrhizobium tropiciagri]|uniref:HNH endonuclease n=1 Tax=Bradyrhizobium tropiciagri TaxID=312253 RepID=UPI001BAD6729|nr:HNH endonuclease [Bradyrhizobium tropiciagri]MBR0868936.1 HNH endonuclease [Bradyrhizobium tropiciagri]
MSKTKHLLPPVEILREAFSIEPHEGRLIRRVATKHCAVGEEAGYSNSIGYRQVAFGGKIHSVHRIAWALYYGEHPAGEVDHINGDRSDNRLCNLRLATSSQNNQNRRLCSRNRSGVKGVFRVKQWNDGSIWRVSIGHSGSKYYIRHFHCFGQAVKHSREMRAKLHQEFARAA